GSLEATERPPFFSADRHHVKPTSAASQPPFGTWAVNVALPPGGRATGPTPVPHQPRSRSFHFPSVRSRKRYSGEIVPSLSGGAAAADWGGPQWPYVSTTVVLRPAHVPAGVLPTT